MESAGYDFQRRTRQEFLNLARADSARFLVVDASQGIEAVWNTIRNDAGQLLGGAAASTGIPEISEISGIPGVSGDVRQTGERSS